jgi:hypothetical protein
VPDEPNVGGSSWGGPVVDASSEVRVQAELVLPWRGQWLRMPLRGRWLVWFLDVDVSQGSVVSISVAELEVSLGPPGSDWLWVTL